MFKNFSNRKIISGVQAKRRIELPRAIWSLTWSGLRSRGAGIKESAAVWAGRRADELESVESVYFLDDYAGGEQRRGYHRVAVEALTEFFATLQRQGQVIIGDIHTHPTDWVGLSALDEENPIEFRVGLPAIVLPCFAKPSPSLSICGVHIYWGKGKWRPLGDAQKRELFTFT
jgi:hypothetical protein